MVSAVRLAPPIVLWEWLCWRNVPSRKSRNAAQSESRVGYWRRTPCRDEGEDRRNTTGRIWEQNIIFDVFDEFKTRDENHSLIYTMPVEEKRTVGKIAFVIFMCCFKLVQIRWICLTNNSQTTTPNRIRLTSIFSSSPERVRIEDR